MDTSSKINVPMCIAEQEPDSKFKAIEQTQNEGTGTKFYPVFSYQ
jgi:hypothetical protein